MRSTAFVCIVLLCAAGVARAQDEDSDKAADEAAFLKAKDLMKEGKLQEACDAFGRSQKLDPENGTAYNLALCYEKAGRFASAWALFRQLAQTDTNAARKKDSDKHSQALNSRLTKMLINVDFEGVPGIIITRNGEDVTASVGIESPVDPGNYTIVATAAGYQSFTAQVSATGEGMTVTVAVPPLEKLPDTKVVTPPPPPPPRDDQQPEEDLTATDTGGGGGHRKLIGISVAGVGVAGVAVGLVLGEMASSNHQQALDLCNGSPSSCPTTEAATLANNYESKAKSFGNLSTITVGVGVAALATGVVLWLTAPSGHHHEHAMAIVPTRGGFALSFGGAL